MRLTIELNNVGELEKVIQLLQSLQIKEVKVFPTVETVPTPTITKGDKSIDPKALFGIWKAAPRSLEEIRTKGWSRNWKL
ncbi:MAG: hypothetical protein AB8G22_14260 [Saprospiraceae bacterium]